MSQPYSAHTVRKARLLTRTIGARMSLPPRYDHSPSASALGGAAGAPSMATHQLVDGADEDGCGTAACASATRPTTGRQLEQGK